MSYINDALRKAQQEKDSLYGHYNGIISRLSESPPSLQKKWMVLSIVVLLALGCFFLWLTFSGYLDGKTAVKTARTAKPVVVAAHPVQPATPQALPAENTAADKPSPPSVPAVKEPVISAPSLYREAQAAQRHKKTAAAERLYQRVLTIDAGHVQAMNNLGVIYMSRNKGREAIDLFNRAIYLKKDYVDPYYNLACLHARQNNRAGSLQYLKAAISINPEVADWARNDTDFKNVSALEEFRKLVGTKGEQ